MLDVGVQNPVLDKVIGCATTTQMPYKCRIPMIPVCQRTLMLVIHRCKSHMIESAMCQGKAMNLWTRTSTELHYSPDGYDERALWIQML
ncbi:uncharacterized protein N7479_003915 [Penicillium vulpinum]|uniref:uncharacterized protein n=1 Tax=Penicillium vulpinum TaxID=29845 RepID=UPI002547DD35|nr:uncharacterized protein N7479_003915 [Penicillium vulpinum]KAJ5964039.1 hypothetical protein N7479_003915 [Penicillium vulpinum]